MDLAESLYKKFEVNYKTEAKALDLTKQLNDIHEKLYENGNENN